MRKTMTTAAAILTFAVAGAAFCPTAKPDVEHLGAIPHQTIWGWRIPAYTNNPYWRVRCSWTDPLLAQARCCRALPTGFVPRETPPLLSSRRDIHA